MKNIGKTPWSGTAAASPKAASIWNMLYVIQQNQKSYPAPCGEAEEAHHYGEA